MEIIAEIGQNHNGDMALAKELIHAAHESGAHVAKFQVYEAQKLFSKENNPWFEYNCQAQLSQDQVHELQSLCQKVGIEFLASVFDVQRITWLEEIGVKRYKIASRSINNQSLIQALVQTQKPLIVSLGFWEFDQFPHIETSGGVDFLYCVSKYPTDLQDLNLDQVDFNRYSGFSDHTIGVTAILVALSRGARIIEKHFTLDKKMHGPDHQGSITPEELKSIHPFLSEFEECL